MRLGVADEHRAVRVDEDAVRTTQSAFQRLAFRAVAPSSRAGEGRDRPRARINDTDDVVLGVDDEDISFRPHGDSLRSIERRGFRRTTIAGIPFLAGARDVVNRATIEINPV